MVLNKLNLNEEQYQAATANLGFNLIIASAGTGKTSTIVGRIAYLIEEKKISPEKILLLTFTNKAAQEMKERVASILSKKIASQIEAGTFHAVSYRYLKKIKPELVLKRERDISDIFKTVYDRRDFTKASIYLGEVEAQYYTPQYLYQLYTFYQNVELKLSFADWLAENKPEQKDFLDIYQDIVEEFEEEKQIFNSMNFNDLLLNMKKFLKEFPVKYDEILVDEYQDTNKLQDSLISALKPNSLFCVGDYDQSIYAFNGADISNIATFKERFPNAKVFTLKKNYRSTKPILDLANKVISRNERLYEKQLEVTKLSPNISPVFKKFLDVSDQYQWVAQNIKKSKNNYKDIAVLFRNNSSADSVEAHLRNAGIPSKRRDSRSFFETKEIRAILDIYVFLANPKDLIAFINFMEYAKGIGPAIAKQIYEFLVKLGDGSIYRGLISPNYDYNVRELFSKNRQNTQLLLFDDFVDLGSPQRFKDLNFDDKFLSNPILKYPKLSQDAAFLLYNLKYLMQKFQQVKSPASAISLIGNNDIFKYIWGHLAKQRAQTKTGNSSKELIKDHKNKIYERAKILKRLASKYQNHRAFLNAVILGSNELDSGEGVNLLTVHASKGLEFDEVYIVDLMDGRFPNTKLASRNISFDEENSSRGIDEERRLFYVAVTRAKTILYLTAGMEDKTSLDAQRKIKNYKISQFIKEGNLVTFPAFNN